MTLDQFFSLYGSIVRNSSFDRLVHGLDMRVAHNGDEKAVKEWHKSVQSLTSMPQATGPDRDDSEQVMRAMKLGMLF